MAPPWGFVHRKDNYTGDGLAADPGAGGALPPPSPQQPSLSPSPQPASVGGDYAGYVPSPTIRSAMPPSNSPSGGLFDNDGGLFDEVVKPEVVSPSSSMDSAPPFQESGPRPDSPEALKAKENDMFRKMEDLVTEKNIEGLAGTLKAYGVDVPTDQVKTILPQFMPLLAKYGNRIMGGDNPEKFVEFSAGAAKIAEFIKDIQPLLGAIIAAVMKPPMDAKGRVILRPEDKRNFDNLEQEVDSESLSSFLQGGEAQGSSETGLPSDMKPSPKPMKYSGRGGAGNAALYAADDALPGKKSSGPFESIEEMTARAMESPVFAKEMAVIEQRDASLKARPAAKEAGLPVSKVVPQPVVVEEIKVPALSPPVPRPPVKGPVAEVVEERELDINKVQEDEEDADMMDLYDEKDDLLGDGK